MENLSKEIFDSFQIRKTKVQKTNFFDFLVSESDKRGIKSRIEESGFFN